MSNLKEVTDYVSNELQQRGFAEIRIDKNSDYPLNFAEKCKLFDNLRVTGYNIHTKTDLNGNQYYRIS